MTNSLKADELEMKSHDLSILAEYLRNPHLIANLEEDIKYLNKVTNEEEKRAEEIRFFIQNKEKILIAFEEDMANFEKKVFDHIKEITRLKIIRDELNEMSSLQSETRSLQESQRDIIAGAQAKIDRQNSEERAKLRGDMEAIKTAKAYNEAEAARLKKYEQDLHEHAAGLIQRASQQES